jgi:hypothetical protein
MSGLDWGLIFLGAVIGGCVAYVYKTKQGGVA